MTELNTGTRGDGGILVSLDLQQADTIIELCGERLLLVVAGDSILKVSDGVTVMCANVSDI